MRNPDEFDEFYKAAQHRLLLQTFALTGDLPAARGAVRDAFVAAWHHWRKVSRMPDPEGWVRPHAWLHAQRRHTARIWHRDKTLDAEHQATLDALARLSLNQRKALLLAQTSNVTMEQLAREIGITDEAADQQLQTATAQFAIYREIPSTAIRMPLQALADHLAEVRFPRPTIIRRAGAARRRAHTTAGAVTTVVALLVGGTIVAQDNGVATALRDIGTTSPDDGGAVVDLAPLEVSELLTPHQVATFAKRDFGEADTSDNTSGDGINVACQQERFADPAGVSALVRRFRANGRPELTLVQAVEQSADAAAAGAAYDTMTGWYAGCRDERVQLLSTMAVAGVGDEAMLLVLRGWRAPVSTYTVGVARTGGLVTVVARTVTDGHRPDLHSAVRLMARSVANLCGHQGSGACVGTPHASDVAPPPAESARGLLQVVDLPPATGVTDPWVGTDPIKPVMNPAATTCDNADFRGHELTFATTRSFLVPQAAKLADRFGISETLGTFKSTKLANAFAEGIAQRMAACEDRDRGLGTRVTRIEHHASQRRDLTVWHQVTEVSDSSTVAYWMAIVRLDKTVAQINFVPAPGATISPAAFEALAARALARLENLPAR